MKGLSLGALGRQVSVSTRLMVWNTIAMAVLLVGLGFVVDYSARASILGSIDRELANRTRPFERPPPGPPPGERANGQWRDGRGGLPQEQPKAGPGGGSGPVATAGRGAGTPPAVGPPWMGRGPGPPPGQGGGPRPGPDGPPRNGMRPGQPRTSEDVRRAVQREAERRRGSMFMPRVLRPDGKDAFFPDVAPGPIDARAFRHAVRTHQRLYTTITLQGEPARVYTVPVLPEGRLWMVMQVPYPLADAYHAMRGLRTTLLVLLPVALCLAALGGALVTGRALRPVRDVVDTVATIEAHDTGRRLAVAGRDEFSHLSVTINGMLDRLEAGLQKERGLVKQLELALAQQRQFTADASHELKTPLTVARVNADLLGTDGLTPEQAHESVQDIGRAVDRMGCLVQDLLLLARHDAHQVQAGATDVMVRDVLEQARSGVAVHGAAPIRIAVDDPALTVNGVEGDLVRVFQNLLNNAVRHTPPDGAITVRARADGSSARITVEDTGPGVAPEHLPHLGERFYRIDEARARQDGGTGLGLSICRSIVESCGGSVGFESEPGSGLRVTVLLPRVEAEA